MRVSLDAAKIFIGGDSWGCGEWNPDREDQVNLILHKGLEQYFNDIGYSVINSCRGGIPNNHSIDLLAEQLKRNHSEGDIVFWVQTDAVRDTRPYDTLTAQILEANGLFNLCNQLLVKNYQTLDNLAQQYKTTIYVIGGKHDIYMDGIAEFGNLNPIAPSWSHLLVGEKYPELFPHATYTDWVVGAIDLDRYPKQFAMQVVDEMYHFEQCYKMYQETIFNPDGFHPNREGHLIMFDFLCGKLNLTPDR